MTRCTGFLAALLLLGLLCGCAKKPEAASAALAEPAPVETAELPEDASEEATTPDAAPEPVEAEPVEVSLPDEPLPLTEDGAIAIAEAEATKAYYPHWSEASVYETSYAQLFEREEGATLPPPGGPSLKWTTEAGAAAFTWYDGEFRDEDYGHLTGDMRIWCVNLIETEDPLSNLNIYLNADTGELLGACRYSD